MGKKKQPKRRAWRKADIQDVEEALEDERLVSKIRKKAQNGKAGDGFELELFTVDTSGSCEGLPKATKREIARAKIFPPKGPNIGMSAFEEAKLERAKGWLEAREKQRALEAKKPAETFDLWAPAAPAKVEAEEAAKVSTVRRTPQPVPQKVPKTLHQHISAAPAVVPAHEGQSINPAEQAFEDLACAAAAQQLEREREVEELERTMHPMTAALSELVEESDLKDMDDEAKVKLYQTLVGKAKEEGRDATDEDASAAAVRRSGKRKSQAQRNKEKTRRLLNDKEAHLRAAKKLEKEVGQVGAIFKDMRAKAAWKKSRREYIAELRAKRQEADEAGAVVEKRRRLGKNVFGEEAVIVPDLEAAKAGTMRSMPLKASAVRDRFSSILRRGLLPAPPEASAADVEKGQQKLRKLIRRRQFVSPLLRDSSMRKR